MKFSKRSFLLTFYHSYCRCASIFLPLALKGWEPLLSTLDHLPPILLIKFDYRTLFISLLIFLFASHFPFLFLLAKLCGSSSFFFDDDEEEVDSLTLLQR